MRAPALLLAAVTTLSCALVGSTVAGCGEAVNRPASGDVARAGEAQAPSVKRPLAEVPAETVTPKTASAMGALEHPEHLRRFFDALASLESGERDGAVRVVQFGDSHTAADIGTGAARRVLQERFGDAGRGFVAIGRPYKAYFQDGVRPGMSGAWQPFQRTSRSPAAEKGKLGDGLHGLAGLSLLSGRAGRAWADITARTSRAELAYLEQPGGGSFDVLVDGVRLVRVATRGDRSVSAFRAFELDEAAPHQVEVRAVGDGDVRLFGVSLGRSKPGVIYDALGINGARITTPLSWDEHHWAEQLRHQEPTLVVLAYGTNESTDEAMPARTYERQLVDALGRVARAVPGASCLLLGPPDRAVSTNGEWQTSAKLLEIVDTQRRVAEAAGCAFYDQLLAMGGPGSIAAWAAEDPPRAQKDRVHLTREGYVQLGSSFASDLLRAYASSSRAAQGAAAAAGTALPRDTYASKPDVTAR